MRFCLAGKGQLSSQSRLDRGLLWHRIYIEPRVMQREGLWLVEVGSWNGTCGCMSLATKSKLDGRVSSKARVLASSRSTCIFNTTVIVAADGEV